MTGGSETPAKPSTKRLTPPQQSRRRQLATGHGVVITPGAGDVVASQFNVDVSLQAKNALGNTLLSGYKNQFIDPTGPDGKENPDSTPARAARHPGSW